MAVQAQARANELLQKKTRKKKKAKKKEKEAGATAAAEHLARTPKAKKKKKKKKDGSPRLTSLSYACYCPLLGALSLLSLLVSPERKPGKKSLAPAQRPESRLAALGAPRLPSLRHLARKLGDCVRA